MSEIRKRMERFAEEHGYQLEEIENANKPPITVLRKTKGKSVLRGM